MRTTNKLFKRQVQEHILNSLDNDLTIKEAVERFHTEKYSAAAERKMNKYDAFKDWMTGLPTDFNIEYTNHDIHNTLASWYENAGAKYDPNKLQTDESDWYYHLVTREFRNICKKEGIDF